MPKPWYVEGFGEHYLELYAHRNEREAELSLGLLDVADLKPGDGPVLDLACGGGRHLAGLGRRGFKAVGLDLSRPLLDAARTRMKPGLSLVRADMRRLPFAEASFDGALSMFTSFGYFGSDEENWRSPAELSRVIRPRGWFLFDFLNRRQVLARLAGDTKSRHESDRWTAEEDRRLEGEHVVKRVEIRPRRGGGSPVNYEESVRLYRPEEISAGLSRCGFEEVGRWGDYRGGPFDEEASARFILLLRRERRD